MIPLFLLVACAPGQAASDKAFAPVPEAAPGQAVAVLAGGCFWCLEADLDKLPGVVHTTSGYAGGQEANPTYEQVGAHKTGHAEVVHVVYDTAKLSYAQLLDYFWRHVDPTDAGGQFCDRGDTYRTGIFSIDAEQQRIATESKAKAEAALGRTIVTEVEPLQKFWPAELYHQDFHEKDPGRYLPYRKGCGRDAKVAEIWGKAR